MTELCPIRTVLNALSVSAYAYKGFELAYRDAFVTTAEVEITAKQPVVPSVRQPESSVYPGYSVMESVTARNLLPPIPSHPPTPHY